MYARGWVLHSRDCRCARVHPLPTWILSELVGAASGGLCRLACAGSRLWPRAGGAAAAAWDTPPSSFEQGKAGRHVVGRTSSGWSRGGTKGEGCSAGRAGVEVTSTCRMHRPLLPDAQFCRQHPASPLCRAERAVRHGGCSVVLHGSPILARQRGGGSEIQKSRCCRRGCSGSVQSKRNERPDEKRTVARYSCTLQLHAGVGESTQRRRAWAACRWWVQIGTHATARQAHARAKAAAAIAQPRRA